MTRSHPFLASFLAALSLMWLATCQAVPAAGPSEDVAYFESPDGQRFAVIVPKAPKESQVYADFMVGRFATLTNQPGEAAKRYASVIESVGGDRELTERAIFSALIAGDYAIAARMVAQADEAERGSLVRLVGGIEAVRQGEYERANALLSGGDLGPFNRLIAQGVLGWTVLETDGLEAARQTMISGLTGDALLDGVNLYMLGMVEMSAGDAEGAIRTFEATWATGIRLAVAAEAYGRVLAAEGRMDEALEVLDTFVEEIGVNPAVERLAEEIRAGKTITVEPLTPQQGAAVAIYAPAAALAAQTGDDLAGVYFTMALALDPQLDVARTLWGDALDRADRRVDAAEVLAAVPEDSPYYANARAQLAWVLRRMERNEEAIAMAQDALAFRPDRDLKIQLGDLFRSLENYEQAETIFGEIIAADAARGEMDWRLYYARGTVRERLDRWDEAEVDLRAALAIEPDRAEILNYLGYSLVDRGQKLEEAFAMIQKAVSLRPDAGYIVDSLGWAYYRLGQYEQAVEHLERAVELDPGEPTINDHLGDAYWRVGRRLEAGFQWQRALTLDPAESEAALIADKLESGLPETETRRVAETAAASGVEP